jgi:membrane protease YdiL (CAAX protease family)
MDPARAPLKPALLSIGWIVLVELGAGELSFSPLIATGLARTIEIVFVLAMFHLSSGGIAALGISSENLRHGIRRGIIWSMAMGLIAGLTGITLIGFGVDPMQLIQISLPDSIDRIIVFYIVGGIIAPVGEEIFFRGIIYGYLRNRIRSRNSAFSVAFAMTISTLLFVFAHSGASGIPVPQIVGGIVFCLSYEKEKSLLTPMIIHGTGNMTMFTLALL